MEAITHFPFQPPTRQQRHLTDGASTASRHQPIGKYGQPRLLERELQIKGVSGNRELRIFKRYILSADAFEDNAGDFFSLDDCSP
ncbi:hypothetical protein OM427_30550 [Halomonas sp. 18H]|nr:hypothetical protein [Halomonas sp. 18H]MCW4153845.1 hypothetical protein [Halomonas sp. 18H]